MEVELDRGSGRVMSDQGRAGGTREPGVAVRTMASGVDKGGRSQGRADRSTGRGGVMGSVAGGGARGSI